MSPVEAIRRSSNATRWRPPPPSCAVRGQSGHHASPRGSGRLAIVRAKFGECVANVAEPADLDEGLRDLLTEAYDEAAG